jgi:hypothetical protein
LYSCPDLEALLQDHNPVIQCLQETGLRPINILNLCGITAHSYNNVHGDRINDGMVTFVQDSIYTAAVNLQTPLQASVVHINLPRLSLTLCDTYTPPTALIAQGDLTHLVSQLPTPFIILGDSNAKKYSLECRPY